MDQFEVKVYRKKRRKERGYRRKFQSILNQKERGGEGNKHCLERLALFAQEFIGEELTYEERVQLVKFHRERYLYVALKEKGPLDQPGKADGDVVAEFDNGPSDVDLLRSMD